MTPLCSSRPLTRRCALIVLFTLVLQLITPLLPSGIPAAFAEEGDDGAAGSSNYYQQELGKFGTGAEHVGPSGVMSYAYPMGPVTAAYNSEGGWGVSSHSRISRSSKWGVPTYTDDDIFTLDGEELVSEGGFITMNPIVYHSEHESYRSAQHGVSTR